MTTPLLQRDTTNRRLGSFCRMVKGTSATLKTAPGPYPLVVTAEYRRTSDTYQFDEPAVCVPLISSTGHGDAALNRVHYQDGKFAVANLLVALLPNAAECLPKFLYYFLTARKDSVLVPLMQGTANVSLKIEDIADVLIELPPIEEQRRIVERIDRLYNRAQEARRIQAEIDVAASALLMSIYHRIADKAPQKMLEEVAPLNRRPVSVDSTKTYPQVAVRSFGKGTFHREPLVGADVTWEKPFLVCRGDILISNIKAWEGAIAVANESDDGFVGSHRYLTCVPIPGVATARFVCFHLLTPDGLRHVGEASPGSADRNRTLSTKELLRIPVPVPAHEEQLWFDDQYLRIDAMRQMQRRTNAELNGLQAAYLSTIFGVV